MRRSTECNCFLVCLFIFCFLNIIIRPFFRDINFKLRKRIISLQQDYAFSNMYHLRSARPTFRWRQKLSDIMETIIASEEVFAKYTLRRSLRLGGLGGIVLSCFESKMLWNATLLLNNFLEIKQSESNSPWNLFVIFGLHLFSTEGSWIYFFLPGGGGWNYPIQNTGLHKS